MPDRSPRVLVFGDVIDDVIVTPLGPIRADTDTPAHIVQRPGGSASNAACWLGSLGASVDFLGHVGAADVGQHTAVFAAAGVRALLTGHADVPTGTIVVLIDSEHHSRTMLTERGANVFTGPQDVTDDLLARVDHVHFTGYSIFAGAPVAQVQSMIARAHTADVTVSLDPGSAGFIADYGRDRFLAAARGVDVLLPNFDEGVAITGLDSPNAMVRELARMFPVVALTHDRAGALVVEPGGDPVAVAAVAVDPVDTTGAGDAFTAGFLSAWLTDRDVVAAASAGASAASLAITAHGGRPVTG